MKGQKGHARENNKYILAVDDDPNIVKLIEQALHRQGLKVSAFTEPVMALQDFRINCKDCTMILSDIRMPDMNGNELCKGRKENQSKCKSNLMSAFVIQEKEFHNVLPDIKVDTFLQKPFSIQELNDVVEKINTNID